MNTYTCGPHHTLNTQFVRSPRQATLSNVFRDSVRSLSHQSMWEIIGAPFVFVRKINSFTQQWILISAGHIKHWTPSSFDRPVKHPYEVLSKTVFGASLINQWGNIWSYDFSSSDIFGTMFVCLRPIKQFFHLTVNTNTCGPYHTLNTQFFRSPSQAALLSVVRDSVRS